MIVKQIWTGNAYRNFNYLIACPETGEALAVDPLDHEKSIRGGEKPKGEREAEREKVGGAWVVSRLEGWRGESSR